jgi:hypothetical protein
VAIGSLDKSGRLRQARALAAAQLRGGYRSDDEVRADVLEAVRAEVGSADEAARIADEYLEQARAEWREDAAGWSEPTPHDRLLAAFAALDERGVVVLHAVDDHWAAHDALVDLESRGAAPRGLAFFTETDVWHAVEHDMLEVNLWHADSANVLDTDELLAEAIEVFEANGLPARFDEGRVEVAVAWQRRPPGEG